MIAVYPGVDGDAITQTRLLAAYVRRKRFEARMVAIEVGKLFGDGEPEKVTEAELYAMAGIQPIEVLIDERE